MSRASDVARGVGVDPHLVVAADPQRVVRNHVRGSERSSLIASATVHPEVAGFPARRRFRFLSDRTDGWLAPILGDDLPPRSGGGSVACAAFDLARNWGCSPIIFLGLDLSFPGGRYYADGAQDAGWVPTTVDGEIRINTAPGVVWSAGPPSSLPALGGGSVGTSVTMALFHR